MYVKVKQFTEKYPWSVPVIIILVCLSCVWFYTNRSSNIDTTGIRNAENELRHIREYNQQAVDYNQAKLSTSEQKNELIEALNLIKEQRTQLTEARNLLQKQEQMLNEQKLSLEKAEIYLNEQKKEIHKAKMEQRKSKLLNILLGGTVIYLATKN